MSSNAGCGGSTNGSFAYNAAKLGGCDFEEFFRARVTTLQREVVDAATS